MQESTVNWYNDPVAVFQLNDTWFDVWIFYLFEIRRPKTACSDLESMPPPSPPRPNWRSKSAKRRISCALLFDVIGYNYLGNKRKLHSKDCSFEQHLLGRNLLASPADENSICFRSLFPLNCITLRPLIFLLQREVVCCTTIYLSPLPTDQLESFIENAAPLRSYRLQAAYDFLWWIPLTIYLFAREMAERKIFYY